ncbi:hypothetical protein FLAG1_01316 [Fusarium langsethiae]|uniref:Uncharacterized protein n=1 Tax=Fusarium langsethiae TaxID=179993 RepID=A0A0M9F4G4_FUSLA|nr:hypothetical protein FLAG1_01316 [Fusarium langsethiae]
MTGKPVYKPEEIRFALDQDLFNDEISQAFRQRFNRELTDNQIRYLRNKYGKDPDYGSPLINHPANKKVKRRRAAIAASSVTSPNSEDSPGPSKRTCREPSSSSAGLSLSPPDQQTGLAQIPPLKLEDGQSTLFSAARRFRTPAPQSQFANIRSPPGNSYTLPSTQDAFAPGPSSNRWQTQPDTNFTTGFTPINTRFGQYNANTQGRGTSQATNTTLSPSSLQLPQAQPLHSSSSTQQPDFSSFLNMGFPVTSPQQTAPPPTEFPTETKQEPVKEEGDPAQFSWEEYVRTARPAAGQAPASHLLTRDVEASNGQFQLSQNRPSSSGAVKNEHEGTTQSPSHVASKVKQDSDSGLDPTAIDPRLFSANYDEELFAEKSFF